MPRAAQRPCPHPGCGVLTDGGRCDAHKRAQQRQGNQGRLTTAQRGYGSKWQAARIAYLQTHPLCQCPDCEGGIKRITPATVVDHIIPHRGDSRLFWDQSNWQAMAKQCHDRKTAAQDGGFGHGR